jgi:hypothetical protein
MVTFCIRFIVIWDRLRFLIIRFADYKRKLSQVTTSILRVLQAIPSPLPVVYSIKIHVVQEEQN